MRELSGNVDNKSAMRSATERRAGEKGIQSGGDGTYGCQKCVCAGAGRATPTATPTPTLPRTCPRRVSLWGSTRLGLGGAQDLALGEHKIGFEELHGSLSLVWGSLSLVWADIFLTCFSLLENSSKTHFCPKINETQFCRQFILSFLFGTDFTDNSNMSKSFS